MSSKPPLTDFGFEKIPVEEKTQKVKTLFDRVATSYDLMNDLMSFGLHRFWKQDFIKALPDAPQDVAEFSILDLAGGTGDISALMLKKYANCKATVQCVLADLSEAMIHQGRQKTCFQQETSMNWVCSNGEMLPFPDAQFDLCTLVFGLRNMTNPESVLREILRVLKPGGSFFCLEFSASTSPLLSGAYDLYSFHVIPLLGKWVAGDEKAYQYLVESIRRFPSQPLLANLMEDVGFSEVRFENFLTGIAALHRGVKHAVV
ncbi:MAG: bifunctional demethylmenaquinone methyltransferase/2-methoxy-6-polyprenyl-1,4-benzoquinol methylase UbiE [Alphaproteobacteria bacterium]